MRVLEEGLRRRDGEAWVAKGALCAPFATHASFPHLHCPQAQVCAAAELQRGRRLACLSTPSQSPLRAITGRRRPNSERLENHARGEHSSLCIGLWHELDPAWPGEESCWSTTLSLSARVRLDLPPD